jgi:hypothetical protein
LNHNIFRFNLVSTWSVKKLKNTTTTAIREKIRNMAMSIYVIKDEDLNLAERNTSRINKIEKTIIGEEKNGAFTSPEGKSRRVSID